jgi:hypothetical protein
VRRCGADDADRGVAGRELLILLQCLTQGVKAVGDQLVESCCQVSLAGDHHYHNDSSILSSSSSFNGHAKSPN